eukprot:gene15987-3942_t
MREIFHHLDEDGAGRVTKAAIRRWYSSLEHFGMAHDADAVVNSLIGNNDTLGYGEFAILMLRLAKR